MDVECPPTEEYIPCNEYMVEEFFVPPTKEYFDHLFRMMVLGDSGVGKTSIITRFIEGDASDNIATMTGGVEFKHIVFDVIEKENDVNCAVKLQLWDCAGQPRFREVAKTHFGSKHAYLLFYDVTERTSFDNVDLWMTELRQVVGTPVVYLVANKCDCDVNKRIVTRTEGELKASLIGVPYFETSAQSGLEVKTLFQSLAKSLIDELENT